MYFCGGFSLCRAELAPQNVFCNVTTPRQPRPNRKGRAIVVKSNKAGTGRNSYFM